MRDFGINYRNSVPVKTIDTLDVTDPHTHENDLNLISSVMGYLINNGLSYDFRILDTSKMSPIEITVINSDNLFSKKIIDDFDTMLRSKYQDNNYQSMEELIPFLRYIKEIQKDYHKGNTIYDFMLHVKKTNPETDIVVYFPSVKRNR